VSQAELRANLRADDLGGDVVISDLVIAKLAGRAARRTYGIVDMHRSPVSVLRRFFRGSLTEGVEVDVHEGHADIGLHVIMERGINLAEVTATLESQVRFEVERITGIHVGSVNVRIEDVRL
jgi:uncharacterized alkaline shock family protein YloU